jgi:hypothetical protein
VSVAIDEERDLLRIEDYGLIGDMQAAALVGRDGAVEHPPIHASDRDDHEHNPGPEPPRGCGSLADAS